nr:peroxidase family protein [Kibdelosporangium sp. MJ126-NF4]CEL20263.1 Peroxinectin [Kibdelosporangium sp. MJ126-NF4]CTQ97489.1 Peroxinectin (EC 1.11.1.7) [Kibdelosporangium sp. MJ126-NF4]
MRRTRPVALAGAILIVFPLTATVAPAQQACSPTSVRTLDGSCNNLANPTWGRTNTSYLRVAPANYADGVGRPINGPEPRFVSNRVFSDQSQNLFSENRVTQWGFVWGQFMDHTFGLRQEAGGESAPIRFNANDTLEQFRNDLGSIGFTRTPAAPGTGTGFTTRQQINTVSSYIDGFTVYGGTAQRLEWLREGPVDGNMANNGAKLLMANGTLPRRDARGNVSTAPPMDANGRLQATPGRAMVAGDVRANENWGLTATQTLFALEHNRIVDRLPNTLSQQDKFEIARRIVGAEQQYITYNEFLPALGVTLSPYNGYRSTVNASLSNEFAVVGYRAHSMIHGEFEPSAPVGRYTAEQLERFEAAGIEVEDEGDEVALVVPLNVAFFNPDLLAEVGIGPMLKGIGGEAEYRNDEQIDNQLRSVLFQVPVPGNPGCLDGPELPQCFRGVTDLGAIDIARARDHGLPTYNDLRRAYGLAPRFGFTAITGESTSQFPRDPEIDPANAINDPDILDFVRLNDIRGRDIRLGSPAADSHAVTATRRSSLAARLSATYGGNVNSLDAFTGMIAERHASGREFGELQNAIWRKQFENLRDGDRFFYANDPTLTSIERQYGITYRQTLGQIIAANTGVTTQANVFLTGPTPEWAAGIAYATGDTVTVDDTTFRCRTAHRSQDDWSPDVTPALWQRTTPALRQRLAD